MSKQSHSDLAKISCNMQLEACTLAKSILEEQLKTANTSLEKQTQQTTALELKVRQLEEETAKLQQVVSV